MTKPARSTTRRAFVWIDRDVRRETAKAIMVKGGIWLPKACLITDDAGNYPRIGVPVWLAKRNGVRGFYAETVEPADYGRYA